MKLDQYSKISIAISIEIWVLLIINIILKTFIKEFNSLYIVIAQISLLIIQLINVIFQKKQYEEEWRELFKKYSHSNCRHSITPYLENRKEQ